MSNRRSESRISWSAMSLLFHLLFFAALVAFTPVKEILKPGERPQKPKDAKVSASQVERMNDDLMAARLRELKRQLGELQDIRAFVDGARRSLASDYCVESKRVSGTARDGLVALAEQAKERRAANKSAETVDSLDKLVQKADFAGFAETAKLASDALARQIKEAKGARRESATDELFEKIIAAVKEEDPVAVDLVAKLEAVKPVDAETFDGLDAADAYSLAKDLEVSILETFKDYKAVRTAIVHQFSFDAALAMTDIAKTERYVADDEVLRMRVRTEESLERSKREFARIRAEMDGIMASARNVAEEVRRSASESEDLETRIAQLEEDRTYRLKLEEAAAEDDQERRKDLAELMKESEIPPPQPEPEGEPQPGAEGEMAQNGEGAGEGQNGEGESQGEMAQNGEGKAGQNGEGESQGEMAQNGEGQAGQNGQGQNGEGQMAQNGQGQGNQAKGGDNKSNGVPSKDGKAGGSMVATVGNAGKKLGAGIGNSPGDGDVYVLKEAHDNLPGLVPGNSLVASGDGTGKAPGEWMYVNSWYVIGPFPNPRRVNIHREFPPESVIDLDASYVTDDGRTVRWQFAQAHNKEQPHTWDTPSNANLAEVVPGKAKPFSIWYGYAEVTVDEACDRWIAVGSDDRCDLWINDLKVWGSSDKHKTWRLTEDYRRIHLKKGKNRILVRCENGINVMGWSVCISTRDGVWKK